MSLDQQQATAVGSTAVIGGALIGQGLLTETEKGRTFINRFNEMKSALGNSIKSSRIAQTISGSVSRFTGTAAGAAAKTVGQQIGKGVGLAGIDVGMAGYAISETAKSSSMSEGEKAYSITGEVVGAAVNIAASLATGPFAILIIIGQVLGALLDSFVNPFKNYFNRDLRDMRSAYDAESKRAFINMGINWPLEVKPDIIGNVFGDKETIEEYKKYLQEYYKDKGLITEADFLEDYLILMDLRKLRRFNKKFITDENGYIIGVKRPSKRSMDVLSDVEENLLEIEDDFNQNMLLMLALASYIKKFKQKGKPSIILQYIQINYISIIISVILIITSIISSLFSVSM